MSMRPMPCWVRHAKTWHRGATTPEGLTPKLCDRCLQPIGVMNAGAIVNGPQAVPASVAGQPTGMVTRAQKANVAKFPERRSER